MKKTVIILKGVSGAGKSTVADYIATIYSQGNEAGRTAIVCADDFFFNQDTKEYEFDVSKLGEAHYDCREDFMGCLNDDFFQLIIVANTNTQPRDWQFYHDEATKAGATVFHLVVENHCLQYFM